MARVLLWLFVPFVVSSAASSTPQWITSPSSMTTTLIGVSTKNKALSVGASSLINVGATVERYRDDGTWRHDSMILGPIMLDVAIDLNTTITGNGSLFGERGVL
jgi:hypothetical protein